MKTLVFLIALSLTLLVGPTQADTFKLGVDTVKVLNCDNATTRTDGTELLLQDIDSVICYVDKTDQNDQTPVLTITMEGGCQPMGIDLNSLTPGTWMQFCRTVDSGGRTDGLSAGVPFDLLAPDPAAPNPPIVHP